MLARWTLRLLCTAMLAIAAQAHAQTKPQKIEIPFSMVQSLAGWQYQPEGSGPFPVVIINHGSPTNAADRAKTQALYTVPSEQFLKWGFVVIIPIRRGYGDTGGFWAETYFSCNNPEYVKAGHASADDIEAAVNFAKKLPNVDRERILLVGQSAGGWGALAAATRDDVRVRAVINFAGGRGGMRNGIANNNCNPDSLVEAAGKFGATKRPSLWLYTENDKFFSQELSQRLFDKYQAGGGKGKFVMLPAFGNDGHSLFGVREGLHIWKPHVEAFLKEHQLLN
jgi:dienelactone hydrolase